MKPVVEPVARWQQLQQALLAIAADQSSDRLRAQPSPELSPIGWHLEHSVFVECLWIRSALLSDHRIRDRLAPRCLPELAPKQDRGRRLPPSEELFRWAGETMQKNRVLFGTVRDPDARDPLRGGDRILHFLISHHAQHLETMRTGAWQFEPRPRASEAPAPAVDPEPIAPAAVTLPAGTVWVGNADAARAHDNELPRMRTRHHTVRIASHPATNRDWAAFVSGGGYCDSQWWTPAGWRWRTKADAVAPPGWPATNPDDPVTGVTRHEAAAFARFAGARLPHEHEWEAAHDAGLLRGTGAVWEWCANTFHPYPGFRPFPYREYSLPWFDGSHYVLKGGSCLSEPEVRRAAFRNYYTPDTRYIASGVRLAYDTADHADIG